MAISPMVKNALRRSHPMLRPYLKRARTVTEFHAAVEELTPRQRSRIVRQAIVLFEELYVNLPLKCAMYAIDPLRRLRLLEQRLPTLFNSDRLFHREMTEIFSSLCDQHANYLLPPPYAGTTAWLPFTVEFCQDRGRPHYVVTHVFDGFARGGFRRGAEILFWNGVPIERAVEMASARMPGSRISVRRALGLAILTIRDLRVQSAPEADWVVVGYRSPRGVCGELRVQWIVSGLPPGPHDAKPRGVSIHGAAIQHARRVLYAGHLRKSGTDASARRGRRPPNAGIATGMPDVFEARPVATPKGTFGYLRIYTFDVPDPASFVDEFARLIGELPQNGLIVDVRDNPGGRGRAAEEILQFISPVDPRTGIEPERLNFRNTPLTLLLCRLQRANPDLGPNGARPWISSITAAMQTGTTYSASFPYSDRARCNARGRSYPGPAVVVTSARSCSAAEVFAAGFQDHGGMIVGTDDATGGAGANARTYAQYRDYFRNAPGSPLKPLPMGAGFYLPFRRYQRIGPQAGNEIEDFGVKSDFIHPMTRNDILQDNIDLIAYAAGLLASGRLPIR